MSELKVKDALSAMDYARLALDKAGVTFYSITSARRENNIWLVKAQMLLTRYIVRLDAKTGDILDFTTQ